MTDRAIVQGALMALTLQNRSDRAAPNSTSLMQGMVINRNISAGDTVCCYEYTGADLLRIGDDPAQTSTYWVDDDNRLYEFSNNKIVVMDGLSGEIISNSEDAYDFRVLGGGACCAYRVNSSTEIWRFYFPDGTHTDDILLPGSAGMNYHNGFIGCGVSGNQVGHIYVLNTQGNVLLHNTVTIYNNQVVVSDVVPVSGTVAHADILRSGPYSSSHYAYLVTTIGVADLTVWQNYTTYSTSMIGADQSYYYGWARLANGNSQPLDEWVVVRWPLDGSDDTETVASFTSAISIIGSPTNMGTIRMTQNGATALYEISTMSQLYVEAIPIVPTNNATLAENAGFIWIPGAAPGGVWKKTTLGWLMFPTAVYPRSSPWGKLGFAVRPAMIGTSGLAIVLFE